MSWKNIESVIIKIIISVSLLVLFSGCLAYWIWDPSFDKRIFENEIKKDRRFEELLYFKRVPDLADDLYEIVIKLYNGRIIGGEVRGSIYKLRKLTVIGNYRIDSLYFDNDEDDRVVFRNGIHFFRGISTHLLRIKLNKSSGYFGLDLNKFIDCYDEIMELMEKINNEGRIPGGAEDDGRDLSKWGDEEVFLNYTGYYIYDENYKVKIYVNYIGDIYER